jgi:hypothetical protein
MDDEKPTDPRGSIDVAGLIGALQRHALGNEDMTSTQVNAAIALLKKVLPDLPGSVSKLLVEANEVLKAHEDALQELE